MNSKGELIGLALEGNCESVGSDDPYDLEKNRTIVVEVRHILFLVKEVYGLDRLAEELTVRQRVHLQALALRPPLIWISRFPIAREWPRS